jgi:hypothetical protein
MKSDFDHRLIDLVENLIAQDECHLVWQSLANLRANFHKAVTPLQSTRSDARNGQLFFQFCETSAARQPNSTAIRWHVDCGNASSVEIAILTE